MNSLKISLYQVMIKLAQCFKFILYSRVGDFLKKSAIINSVKNKKEISSNFVASSEYMNFKRGRWNTPQFEPSSTAAEKNELVHVAMKKKMNHKYSKPSLFLGPTFLENWLTNWLVSDSSWPYDKNKKKWHLLLLLLKMTLSEKFVISR